MGFANPAPDVAPVTASAITVLNIRSGDNAGGIYVFASNGGPDFHPSSIAVGAAVSSIIQQ
jgi:hypothetical protein